MCGVRRPLKIPVRDGDKGLVPGGGSKGGGE